MSWIDGLLLLALCPLKYSMAMNSGQEHIKHHYNKYVFKGRSTNMKGGNWTAVENKEYWKGAEICPCNIPLRDLLRGVLSRAGVWAAVALILQGV